MIYRSALEKVTFHHKRSDWSIHLNLLPQFTEVGGEKVLGFIFVFSQKKNLRFVDIYI